MLTPLDTTVGVGCVAPAVVAVVVVEVALPLAAVVTRPPAAAAPVAVEVVPVVEALRVTSGRARDTRPNSLNNLSVNS